MENELTLEQLLAAATEGEQTEVQEPAHRRAQNKTILYFIKEYQLEPGEKRVPTFILYYLYKKHWQKYTKNKLRKVEFFRRFSQEFESRRDGRQRYYLLKDKKLFSEILGEAEFFATNRKENSHAKKVRKEA